MKEPILLDEILNLPDLQNVKIRFNMRYKDGTTYNPIELFKSGEAAQLLKGHYWNYSKRKSFKKGQTTVGFIRLAQKDLWLLFHIGIVTEDLNVYGGLGYKYKALTEYRKYFGGLIVRYKNHSQTLVRNAKTVIHDCEVAQILPDVFDNDLFPGYENVEISWQELSRVITKEGWVSALKNQKGVYLITDTSNGKMYVGSAYGENMILGRWKSYIRNGHGENKELKRLSFEHIKKNFRYSILDIFKSTTEDTTIIEREGWWKETLQTRKFGYNAN